MSKYNFHAFFIFLKDHASYTLGLMSDVESIWNKSSRIYLQVVSYDVFFPLVTCVYMYVRRHITHNGGKKTCQIQFLALIGRNIPCLTCGLIFMLFRYYIGSTMQALNV